MPKSKKVYNEKFIHPQDKLVVLYGKTEYDAFALLRVIADLQELLVFKYGESDESVKYIFEQAGISKEVFEEFDLSDVLDK
jgi:hypothetical protein